MYAYMLNKASYSMLLLGYWSLWQESALLHHSPVIDEQSAKQGRFHTVFACKGNTEKT